MSVSLRDASLGDVEFVYKIQQYPETRRYARNPSVPTFKEHDAWMRKRLESDTCIFMIVTIDGEDGGFVRLDCLEDKLYEISVAIAPSYYGKGVASDAISSLLKQYAGLDVMATVFPDNKASVKLFKSLGFIQQNETEYLYGARL